MTASQGSQRRAWPSSAGQGTELDSRPGVKTGLKHMPVLRLTEGGGLPSSAKGWGWRSLSRESELHMLSDVGDRPPWLPLSTSCTGLPKGTEREAGPARAVRGTTPKLGRVLQLQPGSPGTAAHTGLSPHTLASVGFVLWLFPESPPLPAGLETTAVAGLVTLEEPVLLSGA